MICKGQIIAYYNGKTYPKYINYTFGKINDILERKYENDIDTYGLEIFQKSQVIINATNNETIIITDIYCTMNNQCALIEIKKLFIKYNNQINPYYELKPLIYVDRPLKKLSCFDISIDKNQQCNITNDNNSVCLSYLKDFKYECSFALDIYIHVEFIITIPMFLSLKQMNELVKCNKDNCNSFETLAQIENITRNYAYGNVIMKNNSIGQRTNINQIYYIFLSMFVLIIFSFRYIYMK
ncbi:unnamed protein product [Rotaria sp. Silwood1]|nr:unnamed protein product [Rotaria sp. Silwood1]